MKKAALKPEMKFGAEPKKVAVLAVLIVIAVVVYFWNSSGTPSGSSTPQSAARPAQVVVPAGGTAVRTTARPGRQAAQRPGAGSTQARGMSLQEFRPTLKPKDPIDPARVDPTLKLNLLAKVRGVGVEGGGRSLFDFSTAPVAPVAIAKVNPILPGPSPFIGPVDVKTPPPPPPPPPPPIPLKFYGFTNAMHQARKRAFFLEGEDIFVAGEGDVIKNRYKVVRIGVNSAVVEDTNNKREQTLPLEAEQVIS